MDMSVKLSVSYPATAPLSSAANKPAVAPGVDSVAPGAVSVAAVPATKDADSSKLKAAVQDIEKFVQSVRRNLEFSIDETSGKVVVKVIASETGEVVRQIPSEEVLKLADNLSNASSVLFRGKA